ncbi:MAG TPA: hypothetical protein VJ111_11450 [Chitinophagaceae bacterium]|nr:hypothetical protein [Chitinophagaceae bacterium]
MKKYLLNVFFILFFYNASFSQEGLYQFSKSYFRSDPLIGSFSGFLKHLMNDPAITNKRIRQRTDSTFFYFFGVYNNYNPFFFKPKRVEILLEETSIKYIDSLPADTILVYQLLAYTDGSKGKQEVKKEFEKIHRQYNKKFDDSNYQDLKTGEDTTGGLHNYFVSFAGIAPVSTLWGILKDTNEYILNIIFRIKSSENRTVLPVTLYNP